jgi:hypothetical protein
MSARQMGGPRDTYSRFTVSRETCAWGALGSLRQAPAVGVDESHA